METPTISERSLLSGKTLTRKMLVYVGLIALLFALLLVLNSSGARADTPVPGGAIGSATWDHAGSPYVIQGDVWVNGDLTINGTDGVSVLFDGPYTMTVNGSLSVQGISSGVVTFANSTTSSAYWGGIVFNTADDSEITNAVLVHASNGLLIQDTDVGLLSIQFEDVLGYAIQYVITDDLVAAIEDVNIDSASAPILVTVNDDVDVTLTMTTVVIQYPGSTAVSIVAAAGTPQNITVTATDCSFSAVGSGYAYGFQLIGALDVALDLESSTIYNASTAIQAWSSGGNVNVGVNDGSALSNGNMAIDAWSSADGSQVLIVVDDSEISEMGTGISALATNGTVTLNVNGAEIDAFYPATLNAPEGGVNLDVVNSTIDGLVGSGNCISITAGGLIDINLVNVTITNANGGVYAYSISDNIVLNAEACLFESIPGNALNVVSVEGTVTITLTNDVFNETATIPWIAAVYANALSDLTVTTNGVQIVNSSWGLALWNTNDTIALDFTNTTIGGDNMLRGIWTASENGNVVVNIDNLNLVMMENFLTTEDYDAINVVANTSIAFDATGLSVTYGFDSVHLETNFEGVSASIVDFAFTNFAGDGVFIDSAAEATLTLESGVLNNSGLENQWLVSWGVEVSAMTGIEASVSDVEMITLVNGISLVTLEGDIVATIESVDMTTTTDPSWQMYLPIDGLVFNAVNGSVEVSLSDVSIEPLANGWNGNGVQILAVGDINLEINGLGIAYSYEGLWVESYTGNVNATITGLDVNNTSNVGASFYADDGAIDLAMNDSLINNSNNAGLVVQAIYDTEVELNAVTVINSFGDGVIILVNVEDLVLGITDSLISDVDGIGLNVVVANGQIEATIDPSSIEFTSTGVYLDAMGPVNLTVVGSFVGFAEIGIEIHSFEGGINVVLVDAGIGYTDIYGLFADADNSDIMVSSTNDTLMSYNEIGWYLLTSNGSVSIDVVATTFEYGETGILVESSIDLDANVVGSSFLGQGNLGMDLTADVNVTLNVENSTFDGQIAENAQLFYPTVAEEPYIIIQPEAGNWTTNQSMIASLPFDFDFNGATYDEVLMSLNGWMAFGADGAPDASTVYYFGPSSPNMIAPAQELWSAVDDQMDGYFHGMGYKYDSGLDAVIFQWFVWDATQPQLKNVFEVILYANSEIEFRYAMMDGYNLPNYDFGINMYDGPSWNLHMLDASVFDMDYQSVFFTSETMSDGAAVFAGAGESMVATIDSSSFSHYLGGGVLLVAENGSADIELQGSEFSFIYAITQTMGAFVAAAPNNLMTASVTDCSFDTIGTAAIVLFDSPSLGGADSFVVEGNHFNQVIFTAAIVSVISDEEQNESASYVSSKIFTDNSGTHVGLMAIATIVNATEVAWNIQETDVIEKNNFTGEINPWLLSSISLTAVPYLGDIDVNLDIGMMNVIFVLDSVVGDNQVVHTVSVAGNVLSEGPVSEFFDLGQPMDVGAVTIAEMVTLADGANLTKQTSISVVDNEISATNAPLASGVEVFVGASMSDPIEGLLDSNVNVNLLNNTLSNWNSNGVGLGFAAIQELNGGKGVGMLDVQFVATDNVVSGFGDGIFAGVDTSAINLFGDVPTNVVITIKNNEVSSYGNAIEVNLDTSTAFAHYFPPYEQVVGSNATMNIDVGIINNTVSSSTGGIFVETSAAATEDEFGVFTLSNASIVGPVKVLDNHVTAYWDSFGIDVRSSVSAAVSMATATSNVPVTITNNTIFADWLGAGIYVSNTATATTMALRFNDEPSALMLVALDVSKNTILANSGIMIVQDSTASGGLSHAAVIADISVTANNLTGIDIVGISVDASALSEQIDSYPWAEIDAVINITENNVSGYAGTGINVTVLPNEDEEWWVDITGSISIENNLVSGVEVGIIVSTVVPADIRHNTLTDVVVGIEATGSSVIIIDNTINGVIENDGDGISIGNVSSVTIRGNTISNVGGNGISLVTVNDVLITENTFENIGMSGVYLSGAEFTSYNLNVSNNTFTNIGDSGVEVNNIIGLWVLDNVMTNVSYFGVEVNDATNVFIENNTMSLMNGGVDLYDVSNANIMNNVMSADAVAPVADVPKLAQFIDEGIGVDVDSSNKITVNRNEITGFGEGVEIDDVSDLVFTWNVVTGSRGDGAYFFVDGAVISNNVFSDSGSTGVIIEDSDMVTFANNEVMNNGLDGLFVVETYSLTIVNGMFVDNDMYGLALLNTSVDWNVNAASSVMRNDVLFSGDLTVMAGGSLMLDTVDVGIVPDIRDGRSSINVMAGGALNAIDTEFYATNWYSVEGLSAPFGDYYEFNVYGTLEFVNVYESDALELFLGAGSVVSIETSTITNNVRNGIHIVDSSPVIMSCNIVSNPRNGIFIEGGAAAPKITDCIIADNDRGIYALNTKLETVTDNLIVLNSEAGLFGDNVTGSIHDNTFLLNHKEIYVRNSNVSIEDNQIGYTPLVQLLAQFVPLLQGFNLSTDIFLPELGLTINSMTLQNIIIGHVGIYAINSEVRTSGNTFGMLSTAVQVVNTDLTFGDDIRQNTIIVPYMDNSGIIRNMSLPIPVWDGIVATNSHVVIRGASIDVLDDAVFLDNSTATIHSSTLSGADFNLYLINGSNATATDSTFGKAGAEDRSMISVWEKLTVVVKDPWGAALANVPVKVGSVETTTDSNGMAVVSVLAYVMTSSGKVPASPSAVSANFTNVPTTSYPGHASWQTPVVSEQVTMNGPTTVTLVSGVIVRFDLTVHVLDKDDKNAVNVTVMLHDAANNMVAEAQTNANGTATFVPISYIKNADGTTDNHLTPYKVIATVDKHTAQGTTNLTGNTNLDIKVDLGPQFDYGPAIIIAVFVVILFVATLIVVRRRP